MLFLRLFCVDAEELIVEEDSDIDDVVSRLDNAGSSPVWTDPDAIEAGDMRGERTVPWSDVPCMEAASPREDAWGRVG